MSFQKRHNKNKIILLIYLFWSIQKSTFGLLHLQNRPWQSFRSKDKQKTKIKVFFNHEIIKDNIGFTNRVCKTILGLDKFGMIQVQQVCFQINPKASFVFDKKWLMKSNLGRHFFYKWGKFSLPSTELDKPIFFVGIFVAYLSYSLLSHGA